MSEPFVGEVRPFAITFVPRGWAECNGQLLPISQNTALFSLLGTTYGGDGRTTFGLPNLQDRAPMGEGQGPGRSARRLGQQVGAATETLTTAQMASHSHGVSALGPANTNSPTGAAPATAPTVQQYTTGGTEVPMADGALGSTGGGQPHDNLQPYAAIRYFIALQGMYPPRS